MSENIFSLLADEEEVVIKNKYKVLVADDDLEVHRVTKLMLRDFIFKDYGLEIIDSYTGQETIKMLEEHNDIAVIFLDVVMESSHAGLDVVRIIREDMKNEMTRIILRTGQPGEAPEQSIMRDYDINDYRLKTDMTIQRLYSSLYTALRSYRYIQRIENNRKGLEKIISASANLFKNNSIEDFFKTILEQLSTFYADPTEVVYFQQVSKNVHGFVTLENEELPEIIVGTGKFKKYVGKHLEEVQELNDVLKMIKVHKSDLKQVEVVGDGILIKKVGKNTVNNYIYIESKDVQFDLDLISVFMTTYSIALDNYLLNNMINKTQSEIIITFADVIEKHFEETGRHIERISHMMYEFALINNYSYAESEILKIASTMHDIGKIAIPDAILKKPGKLTVEEFEIIKKHPLIGHEILSKSELPILKTAADIALHHHEKYDGSGYPEGLKGKNIPLSGRMMAIIDVFDAITHKRIYKDAQSREVAIDYIKSQSGSHFDPNLVELFFNNLDQIVHL